MERQPRQRRRPALSCLECRRRKIKCDRNNPCIHCVSTQTQCIYKVYSDIRAVRQHAQNSSEETARSSPSAHTSQIRPNRPILEHDSRPSESQAAAQPAVQGDAFGSHSRNDFRPPNLNQNAELDIRDLVRRIQKLEESSAPHPGHTSIETSQDRSAHQPRLQESQLLFNKTRVLGWTHWLGTASKFDTVIACYLEILGNDKETYLKNVDTGASRTAFQGTEVRAFVDQAGDLLQKCKSIARSLKWGRPSRSLVSPEFGLLALSRNVADAMVDLYFRYFESTHRILHIPTFWIEYQQYWNNPETVKTDLRLKVFLVIGIGSSLYEHKDMDARFHNMEMIYRWIYAAQTWLSGPLEKDRLDITGLQIYCLTVLARQIFSIGGDLVWMSMGSLIHRAMQMGLHRDPKRLPAMSVLQAELRRRLWATMLEMVVQSSLDSSMPPRISFDDFDTEQPSNINDDEISESTTTLEPHPKDSYSSTSIQLALLESLPIRLRIVQLLNGLHPELSYLDVLSLSSEIANASRICNDFTKQNEEFGVRPFHRDLLDYLIRRFMLPLHNPFASRARTNLLFQYSVKISLNIALTIILPEPDQAFSRLMVIGGGMFREGFRCASTAITLELLSEVESQSLDGTLHRSSQYRELLKRAGRDIVSLSSERIRHGETNVKSYMFMRMALAQVEAMEAGTPCEFEVAQSAKNSLEYCHDLLRTRVQSTPNDISLTSTSIDDRQETFELDLGLDLGFFLSDADFC